MLKEGTRVKIMIPLKEQTASTTLKQLNGIIAEVEEAKYYRSKKSAAYYIYRLKDVVSRYGMPYFFAEAWLIPQDEYEVSE